MKRSLSIILSIILIINLIPLNMTYAENKIELIEKKSYNYTLTEQTTPDEIKTVEDENTQPSGTTTSKIPEFTPEELAKMPQLPKAYILAAKYDFFSELQESDKKEVSTYLKKEKKELKNLEKEGYTIIQSLNIIELAQESTFSEADIKQLLKTYNHISKATEIIKIFEERIKYIKTNEIQVEELKTYVTQGYDINSIIDSFIISKALDIEIEKLMLKEDTIQLETSQNNLAQTEQIETAENALVQTREEKEILKKFKINPSTLNDYIVEKENARLIQVESANAKQSEPINQEANKQVLLSSGEIINRDEMNFGETYDKILSYIKDNSIQIEDTLMTNSTYQTQEIIAPDFTYKKYTNAPFKYTSDNEQIHLHNGSLSYTEELVSLRGKNGFDLDLTMTYNSHRAKTYEEEPNEIESVANEYYIKCWGEAYYIPYPTELVVNGKINWSQALRTPTTIYDIEDEYYGLYETTYGCYLGCKNWVNDKVDESIWTHVDDPEESQSGLPYYYRKCGDDYWFADMSHLVQYLKGITVLNSTSVITEVSNLRCIDTYDEDKSPLGLGWTLNIPSIEFIHTDWYDRYGYFHNGNGNEYAIHVNTQDETGEFEEYELDDMTIGFDNTVVVDGRTSKYVITYKNGLKLYFSSSGKCIAKKDKFGNTISFQYVVYGPDASNTYPSKIIDSVGREINFIYSETSTTKKVTIKLPDNNDIEIELDKIPDMPIDVVGENVLKRIKRQNNQETVFTYSLSQGNFDFLEGDSKQPVPNTYALLENITYPTSAQVDFNYEKTTGNLGNYGFLEYFRVTQRKEIESNNDYNIETYTYTGNYTGYGTHNDPNNLPDTYTYTTTITDSNNLAKTYTLSNKHLLKKEEVKENGTTLKTKVENTYNNEKLLTKKVIENYDNSNTVKTVENFEYDTTKYGDLIGYWDTQAQRDSSNEPTNSEHKTTYTYDSNYHIITSRNYKQDSNTTIIEEYTLNPSGSAINTAVIKEKIGTATPVIKQKTDYVYDSYGNITEEKYYTPDLSSYSSIKYSYDDNVAARNGQLDGVYLTKKWIENVKDADNNLIQSRTGVTAGTLDWTYTYDIMGNLKEETDGQGNITSYQYDDIGRITLLTNPNNTTVQYNYDDTNNTLTYTDQAGNQFRKEYDGFGNLKYEKSLLPDKTLKTYEYDSKLRLSKEKNADNKQTIEYAYDDFDRVLEKKILDSNSIEQYKETYVYEDVTTSGESKVTKTIVGEVDAPSIVTVAYIDKHGNTTKDGYIKNSQEKLNEYTYNYLGQPVETKTARHIEENWTEAYTQKNEYDYAGRITKQYDINGNYITTEYDQYGNTIKLTDKKANTLTTPYSTTYTYDVAGRLIKQETPFEDISGTIYNTVSKTYYDRNNNIIKTTTTNNKPGETETTAKTEYQYDIMNRLEKITAYDDGTTENYTQYYYDSRGNKVRMYTGLSSPLIITGLDTVSGADTDYSVTKYEYDKFNNLTKLTDPLGQEQTYVYDNNNNLTQKTDRNGNTIHYNNDDLNRLTLQYVEYADSTTGETVSFTYTKTGQTKTETNDVITKTYNYDETGKLINETTTDGAEKTYTYDTSGNRKSFVLKVDSITKENTSYEYDKLERLQTVKENGSTIATYTYDTNGNRDSLSYTNGNNTDYTYNLANRIKTLINKQGSTTLEQYIYEYTLDGNQVKETESISNKTTDYVYDDLGRLTNETNKTSGSTTASLTYTFDDYNNRATLTTLNDTTSYTYDKNNRLLTEEKVTGSITKTTRYTYDYNGNQLLTVSETLEPSTAQPEEYHIMLLGVDQQTDVTYNEYDSYNRLTKAIVNDTIAEYEYAPNGLRLNKKINGNTTSYVWDGTNIVFEKESTNEVKYIRGINLISRQTATSDQYYLFNVHGDVTALTSNTGQVDKLYEYDAFGNEVNTDINDANPFRYSGEFYDKETGTYYLRARYYDPSIGRFITEDTFLGNNNDPLSLNLYTYCYNNPIKHIDPSGNIAWDIVDIGFAAWSWGEFIADPSLAGFGWAVADTISLLPLLPSASYIRRGGQVINKLDNAAHIAIKYGDDAKTAVSKVPDWVNGFYNKADNINSSNNLLDLNLQLFGKKGTSKSVFKSGSKADALKSLSNLPDEIASNVKRFIKKSGSGYTEYAVEILGNGNYQVKMLKPGDASGYAEYYKVIDSKGKTIETFKDTFDNLGNFIHRKYK